MLRFEPELVRISARKRTTTSLGYSSRLDPPEEFLCITGNNKKNTHTGIYSRARRGVGIKRKKDNLPFVKNAAEITKTQREIARDPLPVIAMLDTCLRLAALNHLEMAMG